MKAFSYWRTGDAGLLEIKSLVAERNTFFQLNLLGRQTLLFALVWQEDGKGHKQMIKKVKLTFLSCSVLGMKRLSCLCPPECQCSLNRRLRSPFITRDSVVVFAVFKPRGRIAQDTHVSVDQLPHPLTQRSPTFPTSRTTSGWRPLL